MQRFGLSEPRHLIIQAEKRLVFIGIQRLFWIKKDGSAHYCKHAKSEKTFTTDLRKFK
jgi:hypothetical protein